MCKKLTLTHLIEKISKNYFTLYKEVMYEFLKILNIKQLPILVVKNKIRRIVILYNLIKYTVWIFLLEMIH